MDWWFDIIGPLWIFMGVIGIILAVVIWATPIAARTPRERDEDVQMGAIVFLGALLAPLTVVGLVIYGFFWLIRTALGK